MKTHTNALTLLLLLGLATAPTAASAQSSAHNAQAALAPSAEKAATLEEGNGGWAFGGSVGLDFCTK